MFLEFLGRLQKELSLTGQAVYETILAIAERVNRKVEILRLHSHASTVLNQIDLAHRDLGERLTTLISRKSVPDQEAGRLTELNQCLAQSVGRIHQLKQSLSTVDTQVRVLKLEAVHEELLLLQRELSRRSAALERMTVLPGSSAIGLKIGELHLPASVRLVTIFRGPFFINPSDNLLLRPDDVLLVIGLQTDLVELGTQLTPATQGAAV